MSEDEQRQLSARREQLRLSAMLESAQRFAANFDVMQREARRGAMKLTLACVDSNRDSSPIKKLRK